MGTRGPVPKRTENRVRRNKSEMENVSVAGGRKVTIPRMNGQWSPVAKMMWRAAKESGQARFYESTDWATLYSLCDQMTYAMAQKKRPAQLIQTIYSELGNLLFTEGARRRVQVELFRPEEEQSSSTQSEAMERWGKKFKVV